MRRAGSARQNARSRDLRWPAPATCRGALSAGRRDEDGDLALGAFLVLGVRRVGRHRPFPPLGALVSRELADADVEWLRAVLDRNGLGIGLEVVVPDGMSRQTALRRDERILAV